MDKEFNLEHFKAMVFSELSYYNEKCMDISTASDVVGNIILNSKSSNIQDLFQDTVEQLFVILEENDGDNVLVKQIARAGVIVCSCKLYFDGR